MRGMEDTADIIYRQESRGEGGMVGSPQTMSISMVHSPLVFEQRIRVSQGFGQSLRQMGSTAEGKMDTPKKKGGDSFRENA